MKCPLILTLLLFGGSRLALAESGAGDSVAAEWSDGRYYSGAVAAVEGDSYKIHHEDGDKRTVNGTDVHAIQPRAEYKDGDRVLARWKGAIMYSGAVEEETPNACKVKWDDGDTPLIVEKSRMIHSRK